MLRGYRTSQNNWDADWAVPSCYHFSALVNIPEIVFWTTSAVIMVVGVIFVGLLGLLLSGLVLPALITIGASILIPGLFMLMVIGLGTRYDGYDYKSVKDVEESYWLMSKQDRKHYRSHLKAVYKFPDKLSKVTNTLFDELKEDRYNSDGQEFLEDIQDRLKTITDAKRIYEESMRKVKS